ncbi:DUF58 domain-containing protein [Patescibacteria group bacterium]
MALQPKEDQSKEDEIRIRKNYIKWCESQLAPEDVKNLKKELADKEPDSTLIDSIIDEIREKLGDYQAISYLKEITRKEEEVKQVGKGEAVRFSDKGPKLPRNLQQFEEALEQEVESGDAEESEKEYSNETMQEHEGELADISGMDHEKLMSKETVGEISPPVKGFFTKGIKIPMPNGFLILTTEDDDEFDYDSEKLREIPESEPDYGPPEYIEQVNDISFTIPMDGDPGSLIPIPADFEPVAAIGSFEHSIEMPDKDSPLMHVNRGFFDEQAALIIRRKEKAAKYNPDKFKPSKKEQEYLSKVLPLPEEIYKLAEEDPDSAAKLVSNYMKNHFRYACNDYLGAFLKEHKEDTHLIAAEVKAGHCDLLSWIEACYLRSLGLSALCSMERCTNAEGDAFMELYGHTRVCYITEDGELRFDDPAATVQSKEFDMQICTEDEIKQLEQDYLEAGSDARKRKILRNFMQRLKTKSNKPEFNKVEPEALPFTGISPAANFEEPKVENRIILENELSVKGFEDLATAECRVHFKMVEEDEFRLERDHPSLIIPGYSHADREGFPITVPPRLVRENLKKMYQFCRKYRVFPPRRSLELPEKSRYKDDPYHQIIRTLFYAKFDLRYRDLVEKIRTVEQMIDYLHIQFEGRGDEYDHDSTLKDSDALEDFKFTKFKNYTGVDTGIWQIETVSNILFSPDFMFTESFKAKVKKALKGEEFIPSLWRSLGDISDMYDDFDVEHMDSLDYDDYLAPFEILLDTMQVPVFYQLCIRAFTDKKLAGKLKEEFGVDKQFLEDFAKTIKFAKNGAKKREVTNPKALQIEGSDCVDPKRMYECVKIPGKEMAKVRGGIRRLFKKLDRSKRKGIGAPRPESFDIRKYQPGDDIRRIHAATFARTGEPHVTIPEKLKAYSDPVHVVFDTEMFSVYDQHLFSTLEVIIAELMRISKQGEGRDIYISTTKHPVYLKLNARDKKQNSRQIAKHLIIESTGPYWAEPMVRDSIFDAALEEEQLSFATKNGLPKNVLFLSPSEGVARAVEYQLRGECNIVSQTYEEAGVLVVNEVRDEWVEEEIDIPSEKADEDEADEMVA